MPKLIQLLRCARWKHTQSSIQGRARSAAEAVKAMRALKARMGAEVRGESCQAMMAAMAEQRKQAIARAANVAHEIASHRSNMLWSLKGRTEQVAAAMSATDVALWGPELCLTSAGVISKLPVEALPGLGVGLVRPSTNVWPLLAAIQPGEIAARSS